MLSKRQIKDSEECEEMDNNGESMDCVDCSCSGCMAHDSNNTDHTIICNSLDCGYNNGKSGCAVIGIEIKDGECESFIEIN